MEIYKSNKKNKKLYQKINYTKLLLVIIVPFIVFSIFFYFVGGKQNIETSIYKASTISFLLGFGSFLGDLIESRSRIFVIDKDDIGYIDIHTERVGGPYLREDEFFDIVKKHGIEEVFTNNHKYEGIDKGIIKSIISVKKKYNRIVLKANVLTKEWKSSSVYSITKLYIVEKERKRKIIIPSDFDNYDDLFKKLSKKNEM